MKIIKKIADLKQEIAANKDKNIGFVPTMGALHNGHLALIKKAKQDNDICVVSIFVNPIQFNNSSDLEKYPRNIERDCEFISDFCDIVFCPSVEEMYPEAPQEHYSFGNLEEVMEGKLRPGHFNGVAIIVKRLFELINPKRAYFGEKDFQQLQIIRKLVEQQKIPVEIIPCPIVREIDGLAMSSRNVRLTSEDRTNAAQIYAILQKYSNIDGKFIMETLENGIFNALSKIHNAKVDYVEICDEATLSHCLYLEENKNYRIFVAVCFGEVRLIDNVILSQNYFQD
jgi:pantoate--beta-alanine ligase